MHYTSGKLSSEYQRTQRAEYASGAACGLGVVSGVLGIVLHDPISASLGGLLLVLGASVFALANGAYTKSRGAVKAAAANKRALDGAPRGP